MRAFYLLSCLLLACVLNGQSDRGEYRSTIWAVELTAGSNFALGYKPLLNRIAVNDRTPLPGWRAGIQATMAGRQSRSILLMGVDVFRDETDLLGYRHTAQSLSGFFPTVDATETRNREGTLAVRETQLRVILAHRITIRKFDVQYGLSVSGRIGGEQTYDFQQTTTSWLDPVTGGRIVFAEPLVSNGSRTFPEDQLNRNTYLGLTLGGGYLITPRLGVRIEWERGLHLRNGSFISNRYKQSHQRLGLYLSYRLFGE